jgi:hypothetical protein
MLMRTTTMFAAFAEMRAEKLNPRLQRRILRSMERHVVAQSRPRKPKKK